MGMRKLIFMALTLAFAISLSACSTTASEMKDGYYTAEAADFDQYGWKEFITVYVNNNKIITVEYNAKNASGFIKSWDLDYMRTMNSECGTYPNEYARSYSVSLLNWQDPAKVDAVTGATHSYSSFQVLAEAVIAQARAGDKQVAFVTLPQSDDLTAGG